MLKAISLLSCLIICTTLFSQDTFLRFEYSTGKSKFVAGDESGMVDNKTYQLGLIIEHEVAGNFIVDEDHGRYYYGLRFRHLHAGSNNSIYQGYESHTYNYLEVPLGIQTDWISLFEHSLVLGTDFGIFGTYPLSVKGERTGPDAIEWSEEYERVWFIFGFNIGGYVGLNFGDKIGIKANRFGQFPFIPITSPKPEGWTGPEYKPQLLTDGGWQFMVNYKF